MNATSVVSAVEAVLGEGVVAWIDLADDLARRLSLALKQGASPAAVAYPANQNQLAEVMAVAHRHGWRVLVCGAASKLGWGGLSAVDLVISTERLNRLVEHAVGDLTVTVEAGMPFAELQRQLAQADQFLAIDPAYADSATVGGIVATGDTGALRQRYGSVRDMLIGISFVRYDGQGAAAGGRVVKNVAGYDLMKLFTGSYGSLGAIAQLTFRTYPMQEASSTVLFSGPSAAIASLFQAVRRSPLTPVALDLLTPNLAETDQLALAARFQAIEAGVVEQVDRLLQLGQAEGLSAQVLTAAEDEGFWQRLGERIWNQAEAPVAKVGLNPAAAATWLEQLDSTLAARIHARGIGLVRLVPEAAEVEALRSQLQAADGYLVLLKAPRELRQQVDIWGYSGNALPVMRAIKAQFDPQGRLSPGRFVGGI